MIKHHYYECETCGAHFEDEGECLQHELKHQIEEVKGEFQCYDQYGDKMELEPSYDCLDEIFYIRILTGKAFLLIEDLYDYYWPHNDYPTDLYTRPNEDEKFNPALVMYRLWCSEWKDLSSEFKRLNDIQEVFEQEG